MVWFGGFAVSNGPQEGKIRQVKLRYYNTNEFKKSAETFYMDISLPILVVAKRINYCNQSLHNAAMWFNISAVSKDHIKMGWCDLR